MSATHPQRRQRKHVNYADALNDDDDQGEGNPTMSDPRKRLAAGPKLYQVARITQLAMDQDTGSAEDADASSKLDKVDAGILSRIQKSLRLAKHPGTGEAEARQALRLATRLMASQNLTQADLIASEDQETAQARAGMSEVEITSTTGAMVRNESWANRIAIAINLFFSVKAYSTSHVGRHRLTWTFYGLAINTVAAATAFEMVHNQVLTWAADNRLAKGRTGKNSYCQGVAAGLVDMARKEKKEELQLAIEAEKKRLRQATKEEKAARQRDIDRLDGPTASRQAKVEEADEVDDVKPVKRSPSEERGGLGAGEPVRRRVKPERPDYSSGLKREGTPGDYGDDYDDGGGGYDDSPGLPLESEADVKPDFDEELERDIIDLTNDSDDEVDVKVKPEPGRGYGVKKEEDGLQEQEAEQASWRDSGQLIQFRQNAEKIADDFLQSQHGGKLKLRKRQASSYVKDAQAYEQGRRDASKIDVKRRRIQGGDA
ncbi:uncharacterized protein PFL1_01930 [Pseudozyma flocculosa PF-1]|uniref:Uncharacterized protein n=1 Tax=Pseudozyma flocculosa TaxID=84751 RepID=A0A5C3F1W3_9BASI|nr:uncharacterized protein PFL1_01930 [Pseudozyma flocculosa PF-1]EPQ30404.1 hypothetical protein PFL1_01930 [Pseudozyma flocculosa PF-1]SPO37479.1 uncharacterized protein PSFLO_02954 [Pseudozyma flocculosa]